MKQTKVTITLNYGLEELKKMYIKHYGEKNVNINQEAGDWISDISTWVADLVNAHMQDFE